VNVSFFTEMGVEKIKEQKEKNEIINGSNDHI
jgi:hypothetical protein